MAETKDRDEQQQDERFDQSLKERVPNKVFDLTCTEAQVDAILSEGEST